MERAGRVGIGHGDQQCSPVLPAGREQLAAEHEEARGVVGAILDLRRQDFESVDLRCGLPRDRSRAALVARAAWLRDQGMQPSRILLLTFTRRAADDMLARAQPGEPIAVTDPADEKYCSLLMPMRI